MNKPPLHKRFLTPKVQLNDIKIGNDHRRFRRRLLVIVEPFAAQSFRFIPHLQQVFVILHHDLYNTKNRSILQLLKRKLLLYSHHHALLLIHTHRVLVELSVQIGFGAATTVGDSKREEILARRRRNVDASWVTVLACVGCANVMN